jgi:hypothetical protein
MPAVDVERLAELREGADIVVALGYVAELVLAELEDVLVLGGRQPLMFVVEQIRASEVELPALEQVLQLPERNESPDGDRRIGWLRGVYEGLDWHDSELLTLHEYAPTN